MLIELHSSKNIRRLERREFLCATTGEGPCFLTCVCGTDVPISLDDLNINRCRNTDASVIDRLCLWSARYVWHSFPFLFQRLLCHRYPCSTQASPQGGSGPTSRFLQNPAVQPLKRLEVALHSTAQMSDHGSYASTDGPVIYKPNELTSD